jgi:hypothetical protein
MKHDNAHIRNVIIYNIEHRELYWSCFTPCHTEISRNHSTSLQITTWVRLQNILLYIVITKNHLTYISLLVISRAKLGLYIESFSRTFAPVFTVWGIDCSLKPRRAQASTQLTLILIHITGYHLLLNGESCTMRSIIICTHPQISLGKSIQGEWGGRGM